MLHKWKTHLSLIIFMKLIKIWLLVLVVNICLIYISNLKYFCSNRTNKLRRFSERNHISLHKKWSFPLRIPSVNVTKCFLRICAVFEPFSEKCDISFWQICQKCENNGLKTEKNIFSLLNLSQKYRKMLDCSRRYSRNFFKFESLKIA